MVRPTWLDTTKKFFSGMFGRSQTIQAPTLSQLLALSDDTVLSPYEKSVYVYSCIRVMADNIARVPTYLARTSVRNNITKVTSGDLYNVMLHPNPYDTSWELVDKTISWWQYRGEAFWILERDSMFDVPRFIWTFDPHLFTVVIADDNSEILGWNFRSGSKNIFISRHNIVHFKSFNPSDSVRGFSATEPARLGIDQSYFASQYNKKFFENGAIISGFLITEEELSNQAYKRLLATFGQRHVGYEKAHRIGLLEGGLDFKSSAFSHKDMDFSNLIKTQKQEILIAFGVSDVILGDYANIKSYEGINAVHRTFWHENLIPKIRYIEHAIYAKFLYLFEGGRVRLKFDLTTVESLKEDLFRKVETAYGLYNLGYPINAINARLELDMPDVAWGSTGFIQNNRIPVSSLDDLQNFGQQPASETTDDSEDEDEDDKGKDKKDEKSALVKSIEKMKQCAFEVSAATEAVVVKTEAKEKETQNILAEISSIQQTLSTKYKDRFKRYLFERRIRVLKCLDDPQKLFGNADEVMAAKKLLLPIYQEIEYAGRKSIENGSGEHLLAEELTTKTCTEIDSALSKAIKDLYEKYSNTEEFKAEFKKLYNLFSHKAASQISKAETANMFMQARISEMLLKGYNHHQWITFKENEHYEKLHGQVSQIGEKFVDIFEELTPYEYPGDSSNPIISTLGITVPVSEELFT